MEQDHIQVVLEDVLDSLEDVVDLLLLFDAEILWQKWIPWEGQDMSLNSHTTCPLARALEVDPL